MPSIPLIVETISSLTKRIYQEDSKSTSLAELVSRDIQITTTMDLLAVDDYEPLNYFLEELHCPAISTYDPENWQRVKEYIAGLAKASKLVTIGIHALQHLHKSQSYGLPLTNAVLLYRTAKEALQEHIEGRSQSLECVIAVAFVLALFETIDYEIVSVLRQPSQGLIDKFTQWHENRHMYSPSLIRMGVWLRIMHTAATRAGGPGLVSEIILDCLPSDLRELLTTYSAATSVANADNESLFAFYFEVEMISAELKTLAHYDRSRITISDQQEVVGSIHLLRRKMDQLWTERPQIMTMTPAKLRQRLPPQKAQSTIELVGILIAAYYGQRIEMGRVLSNPLLSDHDVNEALTAIRDVIDGDWDAVRGGRVSCGYLRPLLLHAVENFDAGQTEWAVSHMRMIRDPICRSDFYAAYAEAVSEMQILKDRRVTMRYFCIQKFGVQPPFL